MSLTERCEVESRIRETDEHEAFGPEELRYFGERLLEEKRRLQQRARNNMIEAVYETEQSPDEIDRAVQLSSRTVLTRLADADRRVLQRIERALGKLESGAFGICEGTGEPISRRRLLLQPWTSFSIEYQEELERRAKHRAPRR